ncbi:MAG: ABC transporter permease [candidate division Zixibacteria bacterium]|nr:ABC transporter permease [candidate division Zixibacteria bacterium]
MKMFLSLAWRNIWRNKKRSIISIVSVMLAVVIALATRSMQLGFYSNSIDNVVSFYSGYIQIHAPGYWEKQSLNNSFIFSDSLVNEVENTNFVTFTAPRIESFALVSAGENTDGALIIGIDPELEDHLTGLKEKVTFGRYFDSEDNGIILAEGLAKHLKLNVGDTVVVLGQGYHDVMAAGKYEMVGLVKYPTSELNNGIAYLTMNEAQNLFVAYNRITSLVVMIDGYDKLSTVENSLKSKYGTDYEILTWEAMMPELVQSIETDNAGGLIMLFIIYMVVGFGILGTVLMMTMERTREFGMLIAVGMKRSYLRAVLVIESILLSFIGVIAGIILGIPVLIYFNINPLRLTGEAAKLTLEYGFEPIFPFSLEPMIFINQAIIVLIIALIAATYPVWKISKIEPVSAIREG